MHCLLRTPQRISGNSLFADVCFAVCHLCHAWCGAAGRAPCCCPPAGLLPCRCQRLHRGWRAQSQIFSKQFMVVYFLSSYGFLFLKQLWSFLKATPWLTPVPCTLLSRKFPGWFHCCGSLSAGILTGKSTAGVCVCVQSTFKQCHVKNIIAIIMLTGRYLVPLENKSQPSAGNGAGTVLHIPFPTRPQLLTTCLCQPGQPGTTAEGWHVNEKSNILKC